MSCVPGEGNNNEHLCNQPLATPCSSEIRPNYPIPVLATSIYVLLYTMVLGLGHIGELIEAISSSQYHGAQAEKLLRENHTTVTVIASAENGNQFRMGSIFFLCGNKIISQLPNN